MVDLRGLGGRVRRGSKWAPVATALSFALLFGAATVPGGTAQPERLPLQPGEVLNAAILNLSRADASAESLGGRVVLAEEYTATWCPPCADAAIAFSRLLDDYSASFRANASATADHEADRLVLLAVHPWPDMGYVANDADPFGIPEANHRMQQKYAAYWFPTVVFDGIAYGEPPEAGNVTRAEGQAERNYRLYMEAIEGRSVVPPAASVGLAGSFASQGKAKVEVSIAPHPRVGDRRLVAYVALVEDHIFFAGANGISDQRFLLRDLVEVGSWRGPAPEAFAAELPLNEQWNASRLSVVAWVETAKPLPVAAAFAGELFGFAVASAAALVFGIAVARYLGRRRSSPEKVPPGGEADRR